MKKRLAMCAVTPLVLASASASAQEFVAGWEGGPSNGYAFAMPVFSFPMNGSQSLVIRPSISYLYYNFPEPGGFTDVTSPGASIGAAYRLRTERLTLTFGPGIESRSEHRRLADGTRLDTTQTGATVAGDIYFQANRRTALTLNGTYGQANRYGWLRGGVLRQIERAEGDTSISVGAEATAQGNYDVKQLQGGGVLGVGFPQIHASLQFRAGYAHLRFSDNSTEHRPYFGCGLYKAF